MRATAGTMTAFLLVRAAVCQDAGSLLAEAQRRAYSASVRYQGFIETFNETGKSSERGLTFERIGPRGDSKILIRFLSPSGLKGTRILLLHSREGPAGHWIWTPASRRTRRITPLEIRLFRAEFSFDDLEEPGLDRYDGKLLAGTTLAGVACWKIELRPKPGTTSPYTHSYLWLRKDNYMIARVENYSESTLRRRIVFGDIRSVQGFWTPHVIDVSQPGRKTRVRVRVRKAEYNIPLDEATFTLPGLTRTSMPDAAGKPPCAYMVQPQSVSVPAGGSAGAILVYTQPGCTWRASADAAWITILGGAGNGSPTGAVSYRVEPNTTRKERSATITLGDRSIAIRQEAR